MIKSNLKARLQQLEEKVKEQFSPHLGTITPLYTYDGKIFIGPDKTKLAELSLSQSQQSTTQPRAIDYRDSLLLPEMAPEERLYTKAEIEALQQQGWKTGIVIHWQDAGC